MKNKKHIKAIYEILLQQAEINRMHGNAIAELDMQNVGTQMELIELREMYKLNNEIYKALLIEMIALKDRITRLETVEPKGRMN